MIMIMTVVQAVCPTLLKAAIHKINNITSRSCTISIPILSLPEVDSISSLSPKSFSTTIVLLKANPKPRKIETIVSNHKNVARKYHAMPVIATCRDHAINDVFHSSLMMVGLSSIPTIKSSKLMPRFPND